MMKQLLFILLSTAAMVAACNSDEIAPNSPSKKKGEIRPFELVRIEAAEGVKLRSAGEDGLLTALEVAKRGDAITGTIWDEQDKRFYEGAERGFARHQRDTISEHPALLMQSTDILDPEGLDVSWIKGRDYVILDRHNDTIAYLPNNILRKVEQEIYKAYSDSNFTEVYRIFNDGFKFKPITGEMWRELREKNQQ